MKGPRIYGSETKCRTAVARYIRGAQELVDQAEGVQKRMADAGILAEFMLLGTGWGDDVRRWVRTARQGLGRYLQDQFGKVLPVLAAGLPPGGGKRRHTIDLDTGVPWLMGVSDELRELQSALGVRRGVATAAPASARFEELRVSGLVSEQVIDDHAGEMASPRTPKQLQNAIGAAKEITEATLRAALDRLDESSKPGDDLPTLMKKWRRATDVLAPPDPRGRAVLDGAEAALANVIRFIGEWRNLYGRGHGRAQYPPGLSERHARLATDAAWTCVRFVVTTLDDLQRLPP